MKKRKRIIIQIFYTLIGSIIIWIGIKSIEIGNIINKLDYQIVAAEKELIDRKAELEVLEEEKKAMATPEYIEKVAREKLGMVKKDDIVFKQK
ncbi:MAG: septum formation initiator family protein [Cellulosilyticaceae bacterium]